MRLAIITIYHKPGDVSRASGVVLPRNLGEWREAGTETSDDVETSSWKAELTEQQYADLYRAWDLADATNEPNLGVLSEYGWLESDSYNFDGMDWNMGGVSPAYAVDLRVCEALRPA